MEHAKHVAEHAADLGAVLPLWSALPFAGILLSIALFPLAAPHFWHRHFPKVSAFWAIAFAVPFVAVFRGQAFQEIVHIYAIDYVPFIILLWALFTVAGGIYVGGTLRATARVNTALLAVGTFLASWIGTTGAAMVMIRPVLRTNAWRTHKVHVIVFFIFLVANIGGSLTPLGDPPLFLGFLHGVPFFWVTTGILRHMLTVTGLLLVGFYLLDARLLRRETAPPPAQTGGERLRLEGAHNLLFLLGIMGAVLFSGSVDLAEIPLYGHVHVQLQNLIRDVALIAIGLASLATTSKPLREKNGFSWGPIQEVAYLFAGIFMTIVPALKILQAGEHGALAPLIRAVREPVHYFWASGILSSFLDNAPTYLTFFNTALGSLGVPESAVPGLLGYLEQEARDPRFIHILEAISAGAVFMGANTYIGNAPNFMVKAIAEEAGVPMPSFFGYMVRYSVPILIPAFVVVSVLYF
jgi:Na+/H+ antiporter NhaD/arsenite permease-like protein